MHLLFVCSRNRRRSPTGEAVFSNESGLQALSAGTAPDAETPLSADLLQWSDVVFAMESVHKRRMLQRFPSETKNKRIVVLGIADDYEFMDERLIARLRTAVANHLGLAEA